MKLGVLFSGQGSQYTGMGLDFINSNKDIKNKVLQYSNTLKMDIESLLNDDQLINDTRYTQPLMVVVEMIIHDYLVNNFNLKIDGYAGFSLGQITSLYTTGFLDELNTLDLVNKRALYMQEEAIKNKGLMAAVIGLNDDLVNSLISEYNTNNEVVVVANYNTVGQVVISGTTDAVNKSINKLKDNGARRVMLLNVSGAFHSPLMKDAGKKLVKSILDYKVGEPTKDLYRNSNTLILNKQSFLEEVDNQISSPVYFKQSINKMVNEGYTHFIEIGPGQVLQGLVKKMDLNLKIISVSKMEDIANLEEFINEFKR